ncbi:adherens junction-associated protein 1 isoform X3 [Elephas maximus indicus]|uniref:adherens junction-associated protein 1 isoform X3 n=1 Tax=Elephas maximus indicus TaxID=99487 RepID=UPI0021163B98|nr:adherens junction-associated protein 1 isoform X3 [Elephas maximus indicus]
MWIQQLLGLSSMSIRWPGCSAGSHAWILIAMFQLAMELPVCESLGPGPEFRLLPRPPHRTPRLWSFKSGQPARMPAPLWSPRPPRLERTHGQLQTPRAKRAHRPRDQVAAFLPRGGLAKPPATARSSPSLASSSSSSSSTAGGGATDQQSLLRRGRRHLQGGGFSNFDFRGSRPTTETEFIAWGPTGEEDALESNTFPGMYGPTTVSILQTRKTTVGTTTTTTTTTTATRATSVTLQTKGLTESLDPRNRIPVGISTMAPSTSPSNNGKDIQPPRILGETSGLAVHQIITITVSLIMVIAALITTLVLKNCCAQSGNTRRNSHQRKMNQQEESCQNLTDFTPARVPSNLDIFTAYNETLQCSHECVRASVPVYTDETLLPAGEYKSTFNGNRTRKPIFLLAADPLLLIDILFLWPLCLRNGLKSPADWPKSFLPPGGRADAMCLYHGSRW